MSVINQMLQGVDKVASQQQSEQATDTAVIVAPAKTSDKLVIILLGCIIILVAISAYLFSQKNQVSQPELYSTNLEQPVVSVNNADDIDKGLNKPSAEVKQNVSVKTTAAASVNATNTAAVVVDPAAKVAVKPETVSVPAATLSQPKPVVLPTKAVTAKLETKPVPIVAPAAKPELAENNVSIKTITRTPLQQAELYFKQAESALLAGDKETAKQLFQKTLKFNKQHDLAREKLAAILYGEQRTKSAVKLLQAGLSISPSYTNFRLMLARIYLKNDNKSQAYYYLKPHQPEMADNVDYYAVLAGLAQSLNDLDVALVAYKKLTEHEPNRAKWWLGLGISADKAQQVELALTAYNKAQQMGQLSASSRNYMNARISQLEKQL